MLFWIYRVKLRRRPQGPRLFLLRQCQNPPRPDALPRRARGLSASLTLSSRAKRDLASRRELTTKRRGELAELAFALKAASLGFGVSKPYGDSERYDFILDSRTASSTISHSDSHLLCHSERSTPDCHPEEGTFCPTKDLSEPRDAERCLRGTNARLARILCPHSSLHRVQVKCSTQFVDGLYRVNAHRRIYGRAVPYLPSEIDFLVAYIIPEDTWYVIPIHAIRGTSLLFRRRRDPKPGLYDRYREAWHLLRPQMHTCPHCGAGALEDLHKLSYNEDMPMTSLNISLPEALKEYVEGQVASGDWGTPSEYVRELIRQDKERRLAHLEQSLIAAAKGPTIEVPVSEIRRKGLVSALRERSRR
jgi:antitoxin ParD1/3/4